jgi:protein-disulfide isomerase
MKHNRDAALDIVTIVVVICAIVVTGAVVHDRMQPRPSRSSTPANPLVFLDDWQDIAAVGHRDGPDDADITIIVFSNFDCPMCGYFATVTYPEFRARFAGTTSLVYRHWPLANYTLAYPAARASECAAKQGRFVEFHNIVYQNQRQLGVKGVLGLAVDAQIPDMVEFEACARDEKPVPEIERDIQTAKQIGGTGTPTVIINGWLIRGGVEPALLDSMAHAHMERHSLNNLRR